LTTIQNLEEIKTSGFKPKNGGIWFSNNIGDIANVYVFKATERKFEPHVVLSLSINFKGIEIFLDRDRRLTDSFNITQPLSINKFNIVDFYELIHPDVIDEELTVVDLHQYVRLQLNKKFN
jgi:hypothetical protein